MLFIVAIISVVMIANYNGLNTYKLYLYSNVNPNSGTTEINVVMQPMGLDCIPYDSKIKC